MNTPESLRGIVSDLVRRGLPAEYAQRAGSELADHHRDLVIELQGAGLSESEAVAEASRRLGNSPTLVKKTVREYQRRYWCGRWPLVTFLFGPIPLLALIWTAGWVVVFCIFWPLEKLGLLKQYAPDGTISFWEFVLNQVLVAFVCLVAPAIAISALARLAKWAALHRIWLVVSACVLGSISGMIDIGFPEPSMQPTMSDGRPMPADQPLVVVGVPVLAPSFLAAWNWYTRNFAQIFQMVLPLIVASAFFLRARQLSLRSQRHFLSTAS
jgi:hypothetical protein